MEGRAYEEAGAWAEADRIYHGVNDRLESIAGTPEEKSRRVSEFLPRRSQIKLRLAAVAVQRRRYGDAYDNLKKIVKATGLSEPEEIERVQLMASVCEYRNEFDRAKTALREVTKHWKGNPDQLNPALLHLAELENRTKTFEAAEADVEKVLATQNLSDNLKARALELKADSLLGQKRTMAAVESYQSLLDQFENKRPLGSIRYKVGQLLFEKGDVKGAEQVWGKLQGGNNEILWDMAKEKLANAQWQGDYKKYVDRIPAMNGKAIQDDKDEGSK